MRPIRKLTEEVGAAISASAVRQAVHDGQIERIRPWVPESTWNYFTGPDGAKAVAAIQSMNDVKHH